MKTPNRRQLLLGLSTLAASSALTACGDGSLRDPDRPFNNALDLAREASILNTLLALALEAVDGYTQGLESLARLRDDPTRASEERDAAGLAHDVATAFQRHHADHAELLTKVVRALGSTPLRAEDARFKSPSGFSPSVGNLLKLGANEERRAAIGFNVVVQGLARAEHRFIAASIEGNLAQHYVVLEALVGALVAPTPGFDPATAVTQAYVASTADVGGGPGLQELPDLAVDD
ncbi:ferritin-like domain-containing protein [Myxococcus sp. K15C18031901]|uniref:ferritin-like domain-containing protein n=1 Tax=Myxococcus dinghuensis TaxID=2906761 RepID=UPI0020A7EC9A|nr:ferritin-like domain-containing protein [Myxococcus dinghuensis]MCP3099153.1 ferritin-like domain-containing protein [Myxococcus dinghuensis]